MSFVHDDPDFPEPLRIVAERRGLGVALVLDVPAATVRLDATGDASYHANFHVDYPGQHVGNLASIFRPFVLLELGSARVIPHVSRDMTSFVHEHLERGASSAISRTIGRGRSAACIRSSPCSRSSTRSCVDFLAQTALRLPSCAILRMAQGSQRRRHRSRRSPLLHRSRSRRGDARPEADRSTALAVA